MSAALPVAEGREGMEGGCLRGSERSCLLILLPLTLMRCEPSTAPSRRARSLTQVLADLATAQRDIFPGGTPRSGFPCLQTVLLSNLSAGIRERLACLGIANRVPTHDLLSVMPAREHWHLFRTVWGWEKHLGGAGPRCRARSLLTGKICPQPAPRRFLLSPHILPLARGWV